MGDTHTEAAGFDAFSTNMTKPGLDSCLIIILCISLHKKWQLKFQLDFKDCNLELAIEFHLDTLFCGKLNILCSQENGRPYFILQFLFSFREGGSPEEDRDNRGDVDS